MKAAFVGGPSKVTVRDVDEPAPGRGELLVGLDSCGICGSDVEKVFGRYGKASTRLGHEPAGTIIKVGSDLAGFESGERVFTHHHVPCNACRLCRRGCETLCEAYTQSNLEPCGLAQKYVVPAHNIPGVLKLPDSVTFEQAALIEPLACCVRAWDKISYERGDSVAIFGAGPTGIMHMMLARQLGMGKIICTDVNEYRLDFARRLGADETVMASDNIKGITFDGGPDICIVATGSLEALSSAINAAGRGGTVMMFGVPSRGAEARLDMAGAYSKELHIMTSYAASEDDTKKALALIGDQSIDVDALITHRYAIADSQTAFERARSGKDAMKIVIRGA